MNTGPSGDCYALAANAPSRGDTSCQPTARPSNSFFYGTAGSPLCPGTDLSSFVGGTATLSLLHWSVQLSCGVVSVEESTWGQIKGLYR